MDCKFAILAAKKVRNFPKSTGNQNLGNDLILLEKPEEFLKAFPRDHWKEWIGSLAWEDLQKCKFLLLKWCKASNPTVTDIENKRMTDDLSGPMHAALTLTAPFAGSDGEFFIASGLGSFSNGQVSPVQIRTFGRLPQWSRPEYVHSKQNPYLWQWTDKSFPMANLTSDWMTLADQFAKLAQDDTTYLYRMAVAVFRQALSDVWTDFRFTNLVRCAEILIAIPDTKVLKKTYGPQHNAKKEFSRRIIKYYPDPTQAFFPMTDNEVKTRLEAIYQLRSDSVHGKPLAWTLKQQTPNLDEEELFRYEYIAETAARALLRTALGNQTWMNALKDRGSLEATWLSGAL